MNTSSLAGSKARENAKAEVFRFSLIAHVEMAVIVVVQLANDVAGIGMQNRYRSWLMTTFRRALSVTGFPARISSSRNVAIITPPTPSWPVRRLSV